MASLDSFCITDMHTKEPHLFTWTENQAKKGATEIASALLTYLMFTDFSEVEVLRLFSDGCGGQNKNSHVFHTLIFWLKNYAPQNVTKIVLTFPVRGHSLLPADRVFGRVEKDLRKKPFILDPKTYHEVYAKHGKVHILAENWNLYNVKKLEDYYKKVESIRDAKRIIIERKSTIIQTETPSQSQQSTRRNQGRSRGRAHDRSRARGRGSANIRRDPSALLNHVNFGVKVLNTYYGDESSENAVSLLKMTKTHPSLLQRLSMVNEPKPKKKKDVETLLKKQFGDNWIDNQELDWFKNNIFHTSPVTIAETSQINDEDDDHSEDCDCCEPDVGEFV